MFIYVKVGFKYSVDLVPRKSCVHFLVCVGVYIFISLYIYIYMCVCVCVVCGQQPQKCVRTTVVLH